ncbi:olfactory receptor 4N5-like [Protobothrops mucrosquamatus]|uniref:olfactory receptor 4N5-like n=1 Tax=Protobothrops mucrosquamatus TaxID=103944 RepID=UPI0010FB73A4|nr:olfactory receptor 4N5-like [Protobothrops mucrosquamatus]
MENETYSPVTEFVLQGLSQIWEFRLLFCVLLLLFCITILPGNILIVVTILQNPSLESPMFFFLANLALIDIFYSCVTHPKLLLNIFFGCMTISYLGCITQIFFIHFLGGAEMFLLFAMAIDRYVAICHPLHYTMVVTRVICWAMVVISWLGGLIHSIIQVILIILLPFCGPNELDNFFCDITQIIRLACANIYTLEFVMFFSSGIPSIVCFILLLISYVALLMKVRMGSSIGKNKASSICITHIIIIFIMFGPAIYIYCHPFRDYPLDKVVAFFHAMVFPLMNPVIYTLRNKEIQTAMRRLLMKKCLSRVDFLIRSLETSGRNH